MPAPQPTTGSRLRRAAEQLLDLADRADTPRRSIAMTEQLHDEIETVAGDVRASVRGRRR
jgi:hypothetical protein